MSLRVPLCVRLVTARADTHVTRDLRDLVLRSTANGFASATLSLDRPLARDAPEIAPFGRVYAYDGRNGTTVWEGYQEDPGKGVSSDGQVWEISALGPQARAADVRAPWIYIDQSLAERWTRTPGADVEVRNSSEGDSADTAGMRLSIDGGTSVSQQNYYGWTYTGLFDTGQKVARVGFSWSPYGPEIAGVDYQARAGAFDTRLTSSSSDLLLDAHFTTGPVAAGPYIITTHITAGRQVLVLFLAALGTGSWAAPAGLNCRYQDFYILGTRYLRDGTESTAASTYNQAAPDILRAHQVVEDVLGRLLPTFDGPSATIATTNYNIDQLAFPAGATAAEIFDELALLEPAYRWAAWESQSLVAGARSRFEYVPWPTTIRYEASVADGYSAPSSASDLFDRVLVIWEDVVGRTRQRLRTQAVQALDDAGIHRQERLDLGSGTGSDANAVQAGDGFLSDHAVSPASGSLTVARPILDRDAGRMVMPWEIRPGHLVRVNGLAAKPTALVASAPDGASVFRVVASTFTASTASTVLELDTYPRTVQQALARLAKFRMKTQRR
jgi:hypothetical protein